MAFILPVVGIAVFSSFSSVLGSSEWCYHADKCGPEMWPHHGVGWSCGGSQQSPINIEATKAIWNSSLTQFSFTGYSDAKKLYLVKNNGHSVEVELEEGVTITGGGLSGMYKALQFHLHWGNGSSVQGSEHTLNGHRYSMEMHIVHIGEKFASLSEAIRQKSVAVLAFFIEATTTASTNQAWENFRNILPYISAPDDRWQDTFLFSISDLLQSVHDANYFRYTGSLTTPSCSEGVSWTVFEKPVLVSHTVVDTFASEVFFNKSENLRMAKNYRPIQALNKATVFASRSTSTGFHAECQMKTLVAMVVICLIL